MTVSPGSPTGDASRPSAPLPLSEVTAMPPEAKVIGDHTVKADAARTAKAVTAQSISLKERLVRLFTRSKPPAGLTQLKKEMEDVYEGMRSVEKDIEQIGRDDARLAKMTKGTPAYDLALRGAATKYEKAFKDLSGLRQKILLLQTGEESSALKATFTGLLHRHQKLYDQCRVLAHAQECTRENVELKGLLATPKEKILAALDSLSDEVFEEQFAQIASELDTVATKDDQKLADLSRRSKGIHLEKASRDKERERLAKGLEALYEASEPSLAHATAQLLLGTQSGVITASADGLVALSASLEKLKIDCFAHFLMISGGSEGSRQTLTSFIHQLEKAGREVNYRRELLFEQQLAVAPATIKAVFRDMQEVLGRDFDIPIDQKQALMAAFQVEPGLASQYREILSMAKKSMEEIPDMLASGASYASKGEISGKFTVITNVFVKLEGEGKCPLWLLRHIKDFSLMLLSRVGEAGNTQIVTDTMEFALFNPEEPLPEKDLPTKAQRFVDNIAPQKALQAAFPANERKLSQEGYFFWNFSNVYVKNKWTRDPPAGGLETVQWRGNFAFKNRDGTFSEEAKEVTLDLSGLRAKKLTKDVEEGLLGFCVDFCNGVDIKQQHQLPLPNGDTYMARMKLLPKSIRPLISENSDFWDKVDLGAIEIAPEDHKEAIARYETLVTAARTFADKLDKSIVSAFVARNAPAMTITQRITFAAKWRLLALGSQLRAFKKRASEALSFKASLPKSSMSVKVATAAAPALVKALTPEEEEKFEKSLETASEGVRTKFAEAMEACGSNLPTLEQKQEFLSWLNVDVKIRKGADEFAVIPKEQILRREHHINALIDNCERFKLKQEDTPFYLSYLASYFDLSTFLADKRVELKRDVYAFSGSDFHDKQLNNLSGSGLYPITDEMFEVLSSRLVLSPKMITDLEGILSKHRNEQGFVSPGTKVSREDYATILNMIETNYQLPMLPVLEIAYQHSELKNKVVGLLATPELQDIADLGKLSFNALTEVKDFIGVCRVAFEKELLLADGFEEKDVVDKKLRVLGKFFLQIEAAETALFEKQMKGASSVVRLAFQEMQQVVGINYKIPTSLKLVLWEHMKDPKRAAEFRMIMKEATLLRDKNREECSRGIVPESGSEGKKVQEQLFEALALCRPAHSTRNTTFMFEFIRIFGSKIAAEKNVQALTDNFLLAALPLEEIRKIQNIGSVVRFVANLTAAQSRPKYHLSRQEQDLSKAGFIPQQSGVYTYTEWQGHGTPIRTLKLSIASPPVKATDPAVVSTLTASLDLTPVYDLVKTSEHELELIEVMIEVIKANDSVYQKALDASDLKLILGPHGKVPSFLSNDAEFWKWIKDPVEYAAKNPSADIAKMEIEKQTVLRNLQAIVNIAGDFRIKTEPEFFKAMIDHGNGVAV